MNSEQISAIISEATARSGIFVAPRPASIWLLGAAAQCSKPAGHAQTPGDQAHEVTITWTVQ